MQDVFVEDLRLAGLKSHMLLKRLDSRDIIGYPHDMIEKLVTDSIKKLPISFTFVFPQDEVCLNSIKARNIVLC